MLSQYWALKLFSATCLNTGLTPPASLYFALYSTNPTPLNSGTEISGGSYARKAVTFNSTGNGYGTNNILVDFGTATATWGNVNYWALFDASTGGNMILFDQFAYPFNIANGNTLSFPIGTIIVTFGG
jgi:hypothetical protein